ncbi:GAF domain-containing sensor histidine kinase [Aphanothece sacrum]|uniref:histidine kinase n=1 Tax=Aphanothece sacrum FPU1 TaxID=1920663 RepID=A0A401ILJ4_APHSA|nr:GAF domain-containing sensor histidine kinase [Aphanothece sacrum]GBF82111.1 two-component sensor histidine kinase [Aphanothece sacrum FPU1]GBF85045.1 two-component sensor histidine kinase [Aphanothece sacrum FPU3]
MNNNNNQSLLEKLSELSDNLAYLSPHDFLLQLPDKICLILNVDSCILWILNEKEQKFQVGYASQEVDDEYKKIELNLNHPTIKRNFNLNNSSVKNKVFYIKDLKQINFRLISKEEIEKRQWFSIGTLVLKSEQRLVGLVDLLIKKTNQHFSFTKAKRKIFKILGNCAVSAIYKLESEDRKKLQKLIHIMLEMTQKYADNDLWKLLEKGASKLVDFKYIWVSKLDHATGQLKTANQEENSEQEVRKSSINKKKKIGITGKAIEEEKPILVNDINNSPLESIYIKHNSDTVSELDLPIVINDIPVRIGKEMQLGSKSFGVINLESDKENAFSENDKERLWLLARFAATRLERIQSEQKIKQLRRIEKQIFEAKNYDKIIEIIIESITNMLQFTLINISLINPEQTAIQSEYVAGRFLSKDAQEEFKKEVSHSLQSNDIQSDIIKNREIEVIDEFDERFDEEIYDKYKHGDLIRVFIPMIEPSTNLVIGTIEVGYEKRYRKYIYEEDIQIIQSLIDYSVNFLERLRAGMIDKIMHEFKSPIGGIRSNVDFLLRHKINDQINKIEKQDKDYIIIKLKDILTDSEILVNQVGELEYLLGTPNSRKLRFTKTNVFKDIIIKTINQLSPTLKDHKLPHNVSYKSEDIDKINICTDRAKLNQVVYNILINAIKYSKEFPNSLKKDYTQFRVSLEVEEQKECFIIKFQDWGIGINEDDRDKIFEQGFRSFQAQAMDVLGSGLGLSISKNIMKQLGGNLLLKYNGNPTEFHIVLPKQPPKL